MLRITALLVAASLLTACATKGSSEPPTTVPLPSSDARLVELVPAAVREDGLLTIGTDPTYPPLVFSEDGGRTIEGADIDLITGIATILQLEPSFKRETFTALPADVRSGRFDVGMSAFSIRGRDRRTTNAVVYYKSGTLLVRAADVTSLNADDMCDYRIAVLEGSIQIRQLNKISKKCRRADLRPIDIQAFTDFSLVTAAVTTGQADGFVADTPVSQTAIAADPDRLERAGRPFAPTPLGILTAPEFPALTQAVKGALQQLIDSGYYEEIMRKWQITDGAVPRAKVKWAPEPTKKKSKRE